LREQDRAQQDQLIQEVFDRFKSDARWPQADALQLELDRADRDLDVEAIARNLPDELGHLMSDSTREIRLTVHGISQCAGAEEVLDDFIRAVRLFTQHYLEQRQVTKGDLLAVLGGDEHRAHRTFLLLDREGYFLWSGDGPDGRWTREVSRHSRHFRKVTDVRSYLAKRHEIEGQNPYRRALTNAVDAVANLIEGAPTTPSSTTAGLDEPTVDLFICHASEDKAEIAKPLAEEMQRRGFSVWLDEFELTLGDSLRQKIDDGLRRARFGAVILSTPFFKKDWPQRELDGLVAREVSGRKVILPIWHGVGSQDVAARSPLLAGRLAVSTERGIPAIADEVSRAIGDIDTKPRDVTLAPRDAASRSFDEMALALRSNNMVDARRIARATRQRLRDALARAVTGTDAAGLPSVVTDDRKLESWGPVVAPLMRHCEFEVAEFLGAAAACVEYESDVLNLLVDELVREFDDETSSGVVWISAFPRLVVTVLASALLGFATGLEQWDVLSTIAQRRGPRSDAPWVVTGRFLHPATLGDNASVAGQLVRKAVGDAAIADKLGLGSNELDAALIDASILMGVVAIAYYGKDLSPYFWGYEVGPSDVLINRIRARPAILQGLAILAGETPEEFRRVFRDRVIWQSRRAASVLGRFPPEIDIKI
jgi:hypothetical protein